MLTCLKFKTIEIYVALSDGKSEVIIKGNILEAWH